MWDVCPHHSCIYWLRQVAQHFIASDLANNFLLDIIDLNRINNNQNFDGALKFDDNWSKWKEMDYMTEWWIYTLKLMSMSPCQFQWEYIMFTCNLDPGDLSNDNNIVTGKKWMSYYVQEFTNNVMLSSLLQTATDSKVYGTSKHS